MEDYKCLENENLSENVQRSFDNIKKRGNFIRVMLQIIGKKKSEGTIEAFKNEQYSQIGGMIDFVKENYVGRTKRGIFTFEKELDYEKIKHPISNQQEFIFIILWNLLSNADKHKSNYIFGMGIFEKNNKLAFVFTNNSHDISKIIISKIINKEREPEPDRGAWAILNCCAMLEWEISIKENLNNLEIWITTNLKVN